jgi:hypothetical protein
MSAFILDDAVVVLRSGPLLLTAMIRGLPRCNRNGSEGQNERVAGRHIVDAAR